MCVCVCVCVCVCFWRVGFFLSFVRVMCVIVCFDCLLVWFYFYLFIFGFFWFCFCNCRNHSEY